MWAQWLGYRGRGCDTRARTRGPPQCQCHWQWGKPPHKTGECAALGIHLACELGTRPLCRDGANTERILEGQVAASSSHVSELRSRWQYNHPHNVPNLRAQNRFGAHRYALPAFSENKRSKVGPIWDLPRGSHFGPRLDVEFFTSRHLSVPCFRSPDGTSWRVPGLTHIGRR